jgi:lipopolysaccharide export system permease protein
MNTLRRLLYGEILKAIGFVLLAFLSLFLFFDLVDELPALGRVSPLDPERVYGLGDALLYVLLLVPSRVYELLPIAVLIGAVFVLARFAQTSEFTILRTSGLGPWRALRTLMSLGAGFVVLTFVMGDHLAPLSDRAAQLLKAEYQGRISVGRTGAWLKERRDGWQYAINIGAMDRSGQMQDVRIFTINGEGQVVSLVRAAAGQAGQAGEGWNRVFKDASKYQKPCP